MSSVLKVQGSFMGAGLARSSAPAPQRDRVGERAALWHKNGTIERIMRDRGAAGGERLHALEKSIAVLLLGYASTADRNPRCYRSEKDLVEDIGLDRKTFAKYASKLVSRGLIEVRRDRADGAMTYYLANLIAAFAEDGRGISVPETAGVTPINGAAGRTGKVSLSAPAAAVESVRENIPPVREITDTGVGNDPAPVGESFPLPIELIPGTSNDISHELQALARRVGVNTTYFENRPHRVAAATVIVAHADRWGVTGRRLRMLSREHGFAAVAGAVGYVLAQIALGAQHTEDRRSAGKEKSGTEFVRNPAALFETAIARGWADSLSGLGDDPYITQHKTRSITDDLWVALLSEVKTRLSRPVFDTVFPSARLRDHDVSTFTIGVPTDFAATIARQSATSVVVRCLAAMGYGDVTVAFVTDAPDAPPATSKRI
jgi:hypothetical protein